MLSESCLRFGNLHQDKLRESIERIINTSELSYKEALPCSALQDFYLTHMRGKA